MRLYGFETTAFFFSHLLPSPPPPPMWCGARMELCAALRTHDAMISEDDLRISMVMAFLLLYFLMQQRRRSQSRLPPISNDPLASSNGQVLFWRCYFQIMCLKCAFYTICILQMCRLYVASTVAWIIFIKRDPLHPRFAGPCCTSWVVNQTPNLYALREWHVCMFWLPQIHLSTQTDYTLLKLIVYKGNPQHYAIF